MWQMQKQTKETFASFAAVKEWQIWLRQMYLYFVLSCQIYFLPCRQWVAANLYIDATLWHLSTHFWVAWCNWVAFFIPQI
jgi:hypothetical protein